MNILITGHKGFVGSFLYSALRTPHSALAVEVIPGISASSPTIGVRGAKPSSKGS